jgi:hypothetical protein
VNCRDQTDLAAISAAVGIVTPAKSAAQEQIL